MAKTVPKESRFGFSRILWACIAWLLIVAGAIGSLVSVASLGARWDWRLDLLVNLRSQLVLGAAIVVGALAAMRRWKPAMLFGVVLLLNAMDLLPLYLPLYRQPEAHVADIVLVSGNVWTANQRKAAYVDHLRSLDADVMVLLEVDQSWAGELSRLSDTHPHHFIKPLGNNFGVALFSRFPIANARAEYFAGDLPTVVARVAVSPDESLLVVGTHTVPPRKSTLFEHRNSQLREIAEFVAASNVPTVVCGDFNATPWSPFFKSMLRVSKLKDARRGFGLQATWPQTNWPIKIPIDHLLVSSDIHVDDFRVGPHLGSDHRMVIATLRL